MLWSKGAGHISPDPITIPRRGSWRKLLAREGRIRSRLLTWPWFTNTLAKFPRLVEFFRVLPTPVPTHFSIWVFFLFLRIGWPKRKRNLSRLGMKAQLFTKPGTI